MSPRPRVVVVDYGLGNLLSVRRGLEHVGALVEISDDASTISRAPRIVLPGVGAFAQGMAQLSERCLDSALIEATEKGTPLLGICLGMQLLFESSLEFGRTAGLALLEGRVEKIPRVTSTGGSLKVPHVGWSPLVPPQEGEGFGAPLMEGLVAGDAMYFVHSFMAVPDPADRIADALYGGVRIPAIVGRDNVVACQFHPEKSGAAGIGILDRWVSGDALPDRLVGGHLGHRRSA